MARCLPDTGENARQLSERRGRKHLSNKGILFDFDGVVVKSMEQHFEAWQKAFAEKGVQITPQEFFVMEGQGVETIARILGERYNLTDEDTRWIHNRKVNYYNQFMTIEFYDHFHEMLHRLHEKHIPMGIVTGGTRSRVVQIIREYFDDEFDCIVTVDDVINGKPHPDPFLKGAQLLKLDPGQCIVVENAPLGIQGAKRAGMTVIAVTTTLAARNLKQADFICADFREVEARIEELLKKTSGIHPALKKQ